MFKKLCVEGGKGLEEENLRNYILALNLGVELNDEEIFIPSLVHDRNEVYRYLLTKRVRICFLGLLYYKTRCRTLCEVCRTQISGRFI